MLMYDLVLVTCLYLSISYHMHFMLPLCTLNFNALYKIYLKIDILVMLTTYHL